MRSCSSARVSAGREDLDAEERWGADDALGRLGGFTEGQDADVGNAEAGGGDLDALLGESADLPGLAVGEEDGGKETLDGAVRLLSQVALLDLSVDVVAVRVVGVRQVVVDRDEDGCRHRGKYAPGWKRLQGRMRASA